MKYNILVFPCGSEIGLEIHRSLKFSRHVNLIGANSISDHGRFIYDKYIDNVPFVDDDSLIPFLAKVVLKNSIDAIFPTMDKVIYRLKSSEKALGCKVIASNKKTVGICLSKIKTYKVFRDILNTPKIYNNIDEISSFPVFIKPDIGYGSRECYKINNNSELQLFSQTRRMSGLIISEYLPGEEYTVDCFTDRYGELRFVGPRIRGRIVNGISVYTKPIEENTHEFELIANKINSTLNINGAWFFQVKKSSTGSLFLLEIASRLGGSSALNRGKGINFALLSIFNAFDTDVEILENSYKIELDRALGNKYKIEIKYNTVYVDFDDCIIIDDKINIQLLSFLYKNINNGVKIILITKHDGDLNKKLLEYRIGNIFDEIIQIPKSLNKTEFIQADNSIYIDDSYQERKLVHENLGIPVFSPDMVEILY